MRIALDVDGCLSDFVYGFTELAYRMGIYEIYGTSQQVEWTFPFKADPVWEVLKGSWNWWMTLEPLVNESEIATLNAYIADPSHDVYFITSRPRTRGLSAEQQTRYWLAGIGVHVEGASVLATKAGTKGALCAAFDIDIMLDDGPANLVDLEEAGIEAVARAWKYNEDWPVRVDSLIGFLDIMSSPVSTNYRY